MLRVKSCLLVSVNRLRLWQRGTRDRGAARDRTNEGPPALSAHFAINRKPSQESRQGQDVLPINVAEFHRASRQILGV